MENKELEEMKKNVMHIYAINRVLEKDKNSSNNVKKNEVKRILDEMIAEVRKVDPEFDVKKE